MARLKETQIPENPVVEDAPVTSQENEIKQNDVEKPEETDKADELLQHEIQELKQELKHEKVKETKRKKLFKVLLYLVIIVVLIIAVLFLVAWAARYPSVGAMLTHMWGELQLMGERIFR
jgi:preprotein translocase subunit SecF